MKTQAPAYKRRGDSNTAFVQLADSKTKKRKQYSLGEFNSPKSLELYHQIIAQWEGAGRRLPRIVKPEDDLGSLSVSELCIEYWEWAQGYYKKNEVATLKTALRIFRKYYGSEPAESIGPNKMRSLREVMISEEYDWSRRHANAQTYRIIRAFKWGASREILPAVVHDQLTKLEKLKRGYTTARDNPKVVGVDIEAVNKTIPHMSRQVAAIVGIMLHNGARPSEMLNLTLGEIDRTGDIWIADLAEHKTKYRGKSRTLYFGPESQKLLAPFLDRPDNSVLFSPQEVVAEQMAMKTANRTTPLSIGNKPGTNKAYSPKRAPRDRYDAYSFRRAIARACEKAFPCPKELEGDERKKWAKDHRWTPYQLRHRYSTDVSISHSLLESSLSLGHGSARITDDVYAERDRNEMISLAHQVG